MPPAISIRLSVALAGAATVSRPEAVTASGPFSAASAPLAVTAPPLLPIVTRLPRTAAVASCGEASSVIVGTSAVSVTAPLPSALHCATLFAPVSEIAPPAAPDGPNASSRCAVMIPAFCRMLPADCSVTVWPAAVTASPSAMPALPAVSPMPPVPVFVSVAPGLVCTPSPLSRSPPIALSGLFSTSSVPADRLSCPDVAITWPFSAMPPVRLVTSTLLPRTAMPWPGRRGDGSSDRSPTPTSVTAPLARALKLPTALAWPSVIDAA